jgi:hypothetical protein
VATLAPAQSARPSGPSSAEGSSQRHGGEGDGLERRWNCSTKKVKALWNEKKPLESLMTHKYRGCIVVLSINKSVEPNKEQEVLTSGFDQGFTVNTSKRVFRGIW